MNNTIKIILAVLFFVCLLDMPYGYYQVVRFAVMIGFIKLEYNSYENKQQAFVILYVCLAILFQPFVKIALGRELWNALDVIVADGLIASVFNKLPRGRADEVLKD